MNKVLCEFTTPWGERYRVVDVKGDRCVIEQRLTDALGAPAWQSVEAAVGKDPSLARGLLIALVRCGR